MPSVSSETPLFRVRPSGQVEHLGSWNDQHRVLELTAQGFPLLPPGQHRVEGELPWIFWDMCPSGYLGRRLAAHAALPGLGANPRDWMAADVLRVLASAGSELAGNLLVGEQSVRAFEDWRFDPRDAASLLDEVLRDGQLQGPPSSLGGERPKLLGSRFDGSGYLMKFSPPPVTPQGQRWSDLLRMEAHCARTLRAVGVDAVRATVGQASERTTLTVERFDRLRNRGRRGVATLYWLAMERYGDVNLPAPEVLARLHADGLVAEDAVTTCSLVHAFSAAIGNNDAHLGNYGLLFDDAGRASLAPIYDVLPMVFAPRNDELPDDYLGRRTAAEDPRISGWVDQLAELVAADLGLSADFQRRWLGYVHRG